MRFMQEKCSKSQRKRERSRRRKKLKSLLHTHTHTHTHTRIMCTLVQLHRRAHERRVRVPTRRDLFPRRDHAPRRAAVGSAVAGGEGDEDREVGRCELLVSLSHTHTLSIYLTLSLSLSLSISISLYLSFSFSLSHTHTPLSLTCSLSPSPVLPYLVSPTLSSVYLFSPPTSLLQNSIH